MSTLVLQEGPDAEGISRITLNRPAAGNALTLEMVNALSAALFRLSKSSRVIVLSGNGKHFCAGGDKTLIPTPELYDAFRRLSLSLHSSRAVIVAAVQGSSVGGGAEMLLWADFVIAHPKARLFFPEILVNKLPPGGGMARLAVVVGARKAKNLYLTGRAVEATEAKSLHLFDEIHDDPLPRATELASHLVKTAASVLGPMRCALELAIFPDFHAQLDKDDRIFAEWKQQLATEAKL